MTTERRASICIVSHNAYGAITGGDSGFIGGVEWQTSLLARWLAGRGHEVSMLTWDEGGPAEENIDGVRVIKICRQASGIKGVRFFHPKWTRLVSAMREANADTYYHNCSECVTGQIALWCRRNGRAFIFSLASDADCDPCLQELETWRERVLYRYGLRCADRTIAQTETQKDRLLANFGVESTVIPMPCPGPSAEDFSPPDPTSNRVLWIGRVCRVKRPDRLLELAQSMPDLQIDVVGPIYTDTYAQSVMDRARNIPNITVHGAVPRKRVYDFYKSALLLCSTSDYEGFPNTFLEAWSYGLPVVTTFDPNSLIVRHDLGIVTGNVQELIDGIRTLAASPSLFQDKSRNARRYYQANHTPEAALSRFESLFLDLDTARRNHEVQRI